MGVWLISHSWCSLLITSYFYRIFYVYGYINSVKQNRDLREVKMIKYYCRTNNNRIGSVTYQYCMWAVSFLLLYVNNVFYCFAADLITSRCAKGNDKKRKFRTINENVQRNYNHWHGWVFWCPGPENTVIAYYRNYELQRYQNYLLNFSLLAWII